VEPEENVRSNDALVETQMFEDRADKARDPTLRQHYKEMAAHYRALAVEHLDVARHEFAH
jgi:hypothetical protein